jgi:hypothetical protein
MAPLCSILSFSRLPGRLPATATEKFTIYAGRDTGYLV